MPLAFLHLSYGTRDNQDDLRERIEEGRRYARKLGYRLDVFEVSDFKDGHHATRVLFARGVQGIVVPHFIQPQSLPGMDWTRFAVVGIGEISKAVAGADELFFSQASVDHFGTVVQAWREMEARGYRKIGVMLVMTAARLRDDDLRWGAVHACLKYLPPSRRVPPFVIDAQGNIDLPKLKEWVDRHRLDAIIGFNEWTLWALKEVGVRIPEDVAFAMLHRSPDVVTVKESSPIYSMAGMKHIRVEPIFAALELLDQQIRHHERGLRKQPRTLVIHSEWVDGTTAPDRRSIIKRAHKDLGPERLED